uniref:DDE Tnp4 domain-containing protein n=1 Tax=Timema tahoe TaxID=61484 RepID=A0A7R9P115_9NEOP|nr:unnamed protein product [Timema tahoe]
MTDVSSKINIQTGALLMKVLKTFIWKQGEVNVFHGLHQDLDPIAVVGLGRRKGNTVEEGIDENKEAARIASAVGCRALRTLRMANIEVEDFDGLAESAAVGSILEMYESGKHYSLGHVLSDSGIQPYDIISNREQWRIGLVKASSQNYVRQLMEMPAALRFYACGGYQSTVGQDSTVAIAQSSISRAIDEVTRAINDHLFNRWVRLDLHPASLATLRQGFDMENNFPGVIGAIDCTHVAIVAPPIDDPVYRERDYFNRKQFHSINVQLVCDAYMKILNVNSRYPGATHDSFIFANSNLRRALQEVYRRNNNGSMWLLGNSPDLDLNLKLLVLDNLAQHDTSVLANYATEAGYGH